MSDTYKQTITFTKDLKDIALKNSAKRLPKKNLSGYLQLLVIQDNERLHPLPKNHKQKK